jgi:3-hydroxyisobutyrate dehydrogenase-like beta-hydroxyacid dehydrogenase
MSGQNATLHRIGLVGYGEVGTIFGAELRRRGLEVFAADLRAAEPAMRDHARASGIALVDHASALPRDLDLVISAVTAAAAVDAARAAVPILKPGCLYLDINSVSPATKQETGSLIEATGAGFVEAAVMSAVPPYGIAAPMLLGGAHAAAAAPRLAELGFRVTPISERIGVAAATKMCRSVIVKGLEAIVVDGFTAARRYGVEREVIAYLEEAFPGFDWEAQARYCFERMFRHGRRRGEEMREAAATLRDAGIDPAMPAATAGRQFAVAGTAARAASSGNAQSWQDRADLLLNAEDGDPTRR